MLVLTKLSSFLKHVLGLDRAIAYTVLARAITILGSTGTVLLIVHFLSPIEQGYYYALLSLVALQTIFELGFSFVIQQLAAHESVEVVFAPDGGVSGLPRACARLASVFQMMVRWYSRAAILMVMVLLPGGWLFFIHRQSAADHVAWQIPFSLAAVACSATFLLGPFYSFLDGCGQIRQVAAMRLREGAASLIMAWSAMIAHHGLYAPAMVIIGQAAVGCQFIWARRKMLHRLYHYPSDDYRVSWKDEIFPFQWKIAISWLCAYFTAQIFIPLLFTLRGPIDAGQMGMSLSITGYMTFLLLAWVSTKATPFGQLIAQKNFASLDRLFFRSFRLSLVLLALLALLAFAGIVGIQYFFPHLASRLVNPFVFAVLLLTMVSNYVVQSLAIYLRSFKREPFLPLYVITALLSVGMVLLTAKHWGNIGVAISYFSCTGVVGLLSAIQIFRKYRRQLETQSIPALQTEIAQ